MGNHFAYLNGRNGDREAKKNPVLSQPPDALREETERFKAKTNQIGQFMALVRKYSEFETLTPEILRAFIDKVLIYEKEKIDGHYRHTIEIVYNFIGAVEIPALDNLDK